MPSNNMQFVRCWCQCGQSKSSDDNNIFWISGNGSLVYVLFCSRGIFWLGWEKGSPYYAKFGAKTEYHINFHLETAMTTRTRGRSQLHVPFTSFVTTWWFGVNQNTLIECRGWSLIVYSVYTWWGNFDNENRKNKSTIICEPASCHKNY